MQLQNHMDSDDDSDKDFRVKRSEKRQLSRLKKRKDEFLLDEDDLILIEDNRQESKERNKDLGRYCYQALLSYHVLILDKLLF